MTIISNPIQLLLIYKIVNFRPVLLQFYIIKKKQISLLESLLDLFQIYEKNKKLFACIGKDIYLPKPLQAGAPKCKHLNEERT